jgi:hypothetical protein
MKLSLGTALLIAVALAVSACAGTAVNHGPPVALPSAGTSSRLILDGAVRCTATVTTPVQVGQALGVSITFENVSKHTVNVEPPYGGVWAVVKSPDGTTYDTRMPWENTSIPPPRSIPLQPGGTATRRLSELRVRWRGPLRVTPGCDVSAAPPTRVVVTSPGLPASTTAAMNDVVAATGHLLDHCRPRESGVPVVGRIDAPSGHTPPLQARCSITLHRNGDFYAAQLFIVTPPNLPAAHVQDPYEGLAGPYLRNHNTQELGWQFVVTGQGATSVYSAERDTMRSGGRRRAPDWAWDGSTWKPAGDSLCGGDGGGFGALNGPIVEFVSACRS